MLKRGGEQESKFLSLKVRNNIACWQHNLRCATRTLRDTEKKTR